jgi:NADPH2:quinone reductase
MRCNVKAVFFEKFGGNEVLKIGVIPNQKRLEANEVRIQAAYASVNPVDWKIREGYLQSMLPHQFPIIPGWDVAGTVTEVGSQVRTFVSGDEVYAYGRKPTVQHGTYAEEVVLPQESIASPNGTNRRTGA